MIQFYLEEVMPQAENQSLDIKKHVNSLGEKLKTLRLRLRRCVSNRPVLSLAAFRLFPKHHPTPRHTDTEWQELSHFSLSRSGGGTGIQELFTVCQGASAHILILIVV